MGKSRSTNNVHSRRAVAVFGLLVEQLEDEDDSHNEELVAHATSKDRDYYSSHARTAQTRTFVRRQLAALKDGRFEDVEREFGLNQPTKRKEGKP